MATVYAATLSLIPMRCILLSAYVKKKNITIINLLVEKKHNAKLIVVSSTTVTEEVKLKKQVFTFTQISEKEC
jgi:hypothetical protein